MDEREKMREAARERALERMGGGRNEDRQTEPSSTVIESDYFRADVLMEAEDFAASAERVARIMRLQNGLGYEIAGARMAPSGWMEAEGCVMLSLVGQISGSSLYEEWYPENGRPRRKATANSVQAYLERTFGGAAEVSPLAADFEHPEDAELMDAFRQRFRAPYYIRDGASYPTTDDVLSAGRQQQSLLGSQGGFAKKSPYFTATLVSNGTPDTFDRAAYAAAAKMLENAAHALIVPRCVFRREDGRWEIRMAGTSTLRRMFSPVAEPATPEMADAIAYYLDCEVRDFRLFGTTVADAADIVEADRVADEVAGVGLPEPEDFIITDVSEVRAAEAAAAAGQEAPTKERSGEEELAELVGLGPVKEQILEFVEFAAACKARGAQMPSLHMWMTGNPGTGKTTLARIIGHLLYDKGLIPKRSVFVEGDRESLVGQFVGSTAPKTKKLIKKARHGVLFIDEAYALNDGRAGGYGEEALATLVKAMEDCRNNFEKDGFVCIMAGYPELMEQMVSVNPGLRDRFGFKLEFPDYSADELVQVFGLYAAKEGLALEEAAKAVLARRMEAIVAAKDKDFGNARLVRKIFERAKMRQARLFGGDAVLRAETLESVFADKDMAALSGGGSRKARIGFAAA